MLVISTKSVLLRPGGEDERQRGSSMITVQCRRYPDASLIFSTSSAGSGNAKEATSFGNRNVPDRRSTPTCWATRWRVGSPSRNDELCPASYGELDLGASHRQCSIFGARSHDGTQNPGACDVIRAFDAVSCRVALVRPEGSAPLAIRACGCCHRYRPAYRMIFPNCRCGRLA